MPVLCDEDTELREVRGLAQDGPWPSSPARAETGSSWRGIPGRAAGAGEEMLTSQPALDKVLSLTRPISSSVGGHHRTEPPSRLGLQAESAGVRRCSSFSLPWDRQILRTDGTF